MRHVSIMWSAPWEYGVQGGHLEEERSPDSAYRKERQGEGGDHTQEGEGGEKDGYILLAIQSLHAK